MRHIQHTAFALFEEKGFDNVTVEQVAEAADVSQSSIYRYFGTKEGLVFRDEYDDAVFGTILAELESGATVLGALDKGMGGMIEEHFHHDRDITLARTKLWASHEGIRVAVGLYLTKLSERVVEAVMTGGRYDEIEARFIVAALVNGMLSAILSWQQDGASSSLEEYMDRGLSALARVFRADPVPPGRDARTLRGAHANPLRSSRWHTSGSLPRNWR